MLPRQNQGQLLGDLANFSRALHGQTLHDRNFVVGAERRARNLKLHNPHYSFNSAYVFNNN